jgi:NAD(P)-dependent dehydrogenase (short-subunit alcohol dehydrogenase family)
MSSCREVLFDTAELGGKAAAITGGASGIGKAIFQCYAAAGAQVTAVNTGRVTQIAVKLVS